MEITTSIIKVDYSTVKSSFICKGDECRDKLINNFAKIIYSFFNKFEFGKVYLITNADSIYKDLNSIGIKQVKMFNDLGIYFDCEESNPELPKYNYIKIDNIFIYQFYSGYSKTVGSLKNYVKKRIPSIDFNKPCYCVVDWNFAQSSTEDCNKVSNEIVNTFSHVKLLNRYLDAVYYGTSQNIGVVTDVNYYKKRLPNCKYVNLYKHIYESCVKGIEPVENTINARKLLKKLVNLSYQSEKKGISIIFYYRKDTSLEFSSNKLYSVVENDMEQIYASFCVILGIKYGCKFIINPSINDSFLKNYHSLLARDNMYVKDYLTLLDKFPDVTLCYANTMCYYCVIDYDKLRHVDPHLTKEYRFELTITSIQYNPNSGQWLSTKIETAKYNYYDIKVLDFHDYFNLNSNVREEAVNALTEFSTLIRHLKSNLQSKDLAPGEVMHQGNVILYEYDNKTYLGYVVNVTRKLPFILHPMDYSYEPFTMDLSTSNNDNLINLSDLQSIFSDLDWKNTLSILQKRGAKFSTKRLVFKIPSYSVGIIFSSILYNGFSVENVPDYEHASDINVFATTDELGIWCESAKQFRKNSIPDDSSSYNKLKEILDFDALRDKKYFTAFGGLHPFISTNIPIKPELINYRGGKNGKKRK